MKLITWQQIKIALIKHYTAPLSLVFFRFRNGAIYFATGLIIIYLAQTAVEPSLKQELIMLSGIVLTAFGFGLAMVSHMRLIIGRFIQFLIKKD